MKKTILILTLLFTLVISLQPTYAQNVSFKDIYAKKQAALKTMDVGEVGKYMTSNNISAAKKEKDPKAVIFLMNYLSPIKYSTGKETVNSERGSMEISGTARNPELKGKEDTFEGLILFKREGSAWKVEKENLKFKTQSNFIQLKDRLK